MIEFSLDAIGIPLCPSADAAPVSSKPEHGRPAGRPLRLRIIIVRLVFVWRTRQFFRLRGRCRMSMKNKCRFTPGPLLDNRGRDGALMNVDRHNQDLLILQREAPRPRFHEASPGWMRVDWKPTRFGGNMVVLEKLALPDTCSLRRTDVKIEAPPNLYEPAPGGGFFFYRNIWVEPNLRVWDHRTRRWHPVPRLHNAAAGSRLAYLCIHPGLALRGCQYLGFPTDS